MADTSGKRRATRVVLHTAAGMNDSGYAVAAVASAPVAPDPLRVVCRDLYPGMGIAARLPGGVELEGNVAAIPSAA